jgi:hypothetical protein
MAAAARKYLGAGVVGVMTALALAPGRASADGPVCSGWDVEYALNGQLKITDTTMGAGDGVHNVGPGRAVIHFDDRGGSPGGHAKLTVYSMHSHVTVTSKAVFASATVVTDTDSRAIPEGSGVVTEGNLADHTLTWSGPVRSYKTDGTMTCDGSLCGKFGAPPAGASEVHLGPRPFQPPPFQFGGDMKTFSMGFVQTSHADSPKQTTFEAVAGRETRRTCVP